MNLYDKKSRWKIYLMLAAMVIVAVSLYISNYLANNIAASENKNAELLLAAYNSYLIKERDTLSEGLDVGIEFIIMESNNNIPIIVVDGAGEIALAKNFGDSLDKDTVYLRQELKDIKRVGNAPIELDSEIGKYYIYYRHSWLLKALQYFPILNVLLISAFVAVAYLLFSSSRRMEQNQVWVGMAKETAHQLGTPISAIVAWLEHLKEMKNGGGETLMIVDELEKDVKKLELVADRFSKIGSAPDLQVELINEVIRRNFSYMQLRASKHIKFNYPTAVQNYKVAINAHLFDWVIENLLRNALDALEGKGEIGVEIYEEGKYVCIDISDTGKGIPSGKFKTVFQPGYTTKKRGWGLGLSLTKRIVESYHSGKIFVKKSVLNEGTTFCIQLPKQ